MTLLARSFVLLLLLMSCQAAIAQSLQPAPHECLQVLIERELQGWLVFFDSHSATLTPRANAILKEYATTFLRDHGRIMTLNGYSMVQKSLEAIRGLAFGAQSRSPLL